MRARFAVLTAVLTALVPAVAQAAPLQDHGLTINAAPNPIVAGQGVLIYGQLNSPNPGGQTIYLYHRIPPQQQFSIISETTTQPNGFYEFTRPEGIVLTNRFWFVRGPNETYSHTMEEQVAAEVTLAAGAPGSITGEPIVFSGGVTPSHPFQPVLLQEQNPLTGNGWVTIARTFTNGASHFSVPHRWFAPGIYSLQAVFPGDPRNIRAASGNPVSVTITQRQHPYFTINASPSIIPFRSSVTISGVLYRGGTTQPEPNVAVELLARTAGQPFQGVADTVTGADGSYSFTQAPERNTVYRVVTLAKPLRGTAPAFVGVQDTLTFSASSATGEVGGSDTFSGTVAPDQTGQIIYLQRLGDDGNWHNVAAAVVGAGSAYSLSYTFSQEGSFQFRSRIYGSPANIGAASSPVTVVVSGVSPYAPPAQPAPLTPTPALAAPR